MAAEFKILDIVQATRDGQFDVIIHGCHCFCLMESGVAKLLADAFPVIRTADNATKRGDASKLGEYTYGVIDLPTREKPCVIVNGYSQLYYGRKHHTAGGFDYAVLTRLLKKIKHRFGGRQLNFIMPFIGADRAGGDPEKILHIINAILGNEEHVTIALFKEANRRTPKGMKPYFDLVL